MMTRRIHMLGCVVAACVLSVAGPLGAADPGNIGVGAEDAAVTAVANEMPQDAAAAQAAPLVEMPIAPAEPAAAGPGVPVAGEGKAGALVIDPAIVDKAMSSYSFTMKQLMNQAEQNMARIQKVLAEKAKNKAEKASPQAVSAEKPSPQARREAYERSRQERAARRQAEQAAACAERRKCEVERKARRDQACAERARQESDRKARAEARRASLAAAQAQRNAARQHTAAVGHACAATVAAVRPVEAAKAAPAAHRTGDLSPAAVACVSAAGATPEQFLAKQAMQERAIACEQARFAGEWARRRDACHSGLRDTSDPAALMARQARQEAAIAREEARFAADNRQCPVGQVPRITAADMARVQEKYCVSTVEDIAAARAYAARQDACGK